MKFTNSVIIVTIQLSLVVKNISSKSIKDSIGFPELEENVMLVNKKVRILWYSQWDFSIFKNVVCFEL